MTPDEKAEAIYRYGVNVFPLWRAPFISFGIHFDWCTPEVTLHFPWLTIAIGRVSFIDANPAHRRRFRVMGGDAHWLSDRRREELSQ